MRGAARPGRWLPWEQDPFEVVKLPMLFAQRCLREHSGNRTVSLFGSCGSSNFLDNYTEPYEIRNDPTPSLRWLW